MAAASAVQRDRASGQVSLFETMDLAPAPRKGKSKEIEPWPQRELLDYEKELLGFYVTGHPLDEYAGSLEAARIRPISTLEEIEGQETVRIAGMVLSVEKKFTKKDSKQFAVFQLEDFTGSVEVTAWDEAFAKAGELLKPGVVVEVSARVQKREDGLRISANTIAEVKKRPSRKPVVLRLDRNDLQGGVLARIAELAAREKGKRPLEIELVTPHGVCVLAAASRFAIEREAAFRQGVENLLAAAKSA
jgi:DNA polymerase-3 subunit alpha